MVLLCGFVLYYSLDLPRPFIYVLIGGCPIGMLYHLTYS